MTCSGHYDAISAGKMPKENSSCSTPLSLASQKAKNAIDHGTAIVQKSSFDNDTDLRDALIARAAEHVFEQKVCTGHPETALVS